MLVPAAELLHRNAAADEVAAHVADQGHVAGVGEIAPLHAADGLVARHVEIGGVRIGSETGRIGQGHEFVPAAVEDHVHVADLFRVGIGLLGPGPGKGEVTALARTHQVHGDHRKLHGGAATQEQDLVVVRQTVQALDQVHGFHVHRVVFGGPVAHLYKGHAFTLVVQEFGMGFFQSGIGQGAGPRAEVEYPVHRSPPRKFSTRSQASSPIRSRFSLLEAPRCGDMNTLGALSRG